jgi:hypothetical protein
MINIYDSFFTADECREIYSQLSTEFERSGGDTTVYGKLVDHKPLPWTNTILDIKQFVEDRLDLQFDTATLTRGHQEVQRDKTVVALLSFGSNRTFQLRWKDSPKATVTGTLQNGSLLLLPAETRVSYPCRLSGPLEDPPTLNLLLNSRSR